jgi:hypothetical protein
LGTHRNFKLGAPKLRTGDTTKPYTGDIETSNGRRTNTKSKSQTGLKPKIKNLVGLRQHNLKAPPEQSAYHLSERAPQFANLCLANLSCCQAEQTAAALDAVLSIKENSYQQTVTNKQSPTNSYQTLTNKQLPNSYQQTPDLHAGCCSESKSPKFYRIKALGALKGTPVHISCTGTPNVETVHCRAVSEARRKIPPLMPRSIHVSLRKAERKQRRGLSRGKIYVLYTYTHSTYIPDVL